MIDLREAGVFRGVEDSSRIADGAHAAVARVDEERLTRRRYEQRRVTAFDVDDIDVQRLRAACLCQRHERSAYDNRDDTANSTHRHDPRRVGRVLSDPA